MSVQTMTDVVGNCGFKINIDQWNSQESDAKAKVPDWSDEKKAERWINPNPNSTISQ